MPAESPDLDHWTSYLQESLAGNEGLRQGLHDDDAIPFIEWGRARAVHLAARLVGGESPPDEDAADEMAGLLADLMTSITWVVVFRHKQDAAWLSDTLHQMNQTSQELFGENAPALSDEEITAWVAGHASRADGDLLRDLMARFSPVPESGTPESGTPEAGTPESSTPEAVTTDSAPPPPAPTITLLTAGIFPLSPVEDDNDQKQNDLPQ